MQEFKIRPGSFDELKGKIILRSLIIYAVIISLVGFFLISGDKIDKSVLFVFPILFGVMVISLFINLKKQRKVFESQVIRLEEGKISRVSEFLPPIDIFFQDVKSIKKAPNGAMSVTGTSKLNPIFIPAQMEGRDEIEAVLSTIMPIEAVSGGAGKFQLPLTFAMLAVFVIPFATDNKIIGIVFLSLSVVILAGSLVMIQRSKHLDRKVKLMAWMGLIPLMVLITWLVKRLQEF